MPQLPEYVGLLLLGEGEDETFCGSTFPISEADRLYLGATHTIPADRRDELHIAIQNPFGRLMFTKVLDFEVLEGQPDVVVLQAEDGRPPHLPLAANPAFIGRAFRRRAIRSGTSGKWSQGHSSPVFEGSSVP